MGHFRPNLADAVIELSPFGHSMRELSGWLAILRQAWRHRGAKERPENEPPTAPVKPRPQPYDPLMHGKPKPQRA